MLLAAPFCCIFFWRKLNGAHWLLLLLWFKEVAAPGSANLESSSEVPTYLRLLFAAPICSWMFVLAKNVELFSLDLFQDFGLLRFE